MSTPTERTETEKCDKCKANDALDPHTCPYAEEINDDSRTLCNCCDDCTSECADDV
jgi:hypothetical protein